MRVKRNTAPVEGEAEAWGPDTRDEFKRLAGSQFLREDGDGNAVIVTVEGEQVTVPPGGLVILQDGRGDGEAQFAGAHQLGTGEWPAWNPAPPGRR
jgi:hypothetical protein